MGELLFCGHPSCAVGPDNAVLRREAVWSLFYFTDLKMFAHWHHSAQGVGVVNGFYTPKPRMYPKEMRQAANLCEKTTPLFFTHVNGLKIVFARRKLKKVSGKVKLPCPWLKAG